MSLILVTSACVLLLVIAFVVILVSIRRAVTARQRVMSVQGVETATPSNFPYPSSFDADEDWSVAMVVDECSINMMESPLHKMIRKRRSASCGSEDIGRDRQQVGQSAGCICWLAICSVCIGCLI